MSGRTKTEDKWRSKMAVELYIASFHLAALGWPQDTIDAIKQAADDVREGTLSPPTRKD